MQLRFGRIAIAVVLAEILGVGALALIVFLTAPPGTQQEIQHYAEGLGQYVGPISGFVLCILGGWWVARAAVPGSRFVNGLAMGIAAALLDLAIGLAISPAFSMLLIYSNAGRIVGGAIGGWIAARGT